jgi:hypothetical protein
MGAFAVSYRSRGRSQRPVRRSGTVKSVTWTTLIIKYIDYQLIQVKNRTAEAVGFIKQKPGWLMDLLSDPAWLALLFDLI